MKSNIKITKDKIIKEMENTDDMAVVAAYLYAKNSIEHGVDVLEKWDTAVRNSANLEKAYQKGFYEGLAEGRPHSDETSIRLTVYQFMREVMCMGADAVIVDRDTKKKVWKHRKSLNVKDDMPIQILEEQFCGVTALPEYPNCIVIYIENSADLKRKEFAYY